VLPPRPAAQAGGAEAGLDFDAFLRALALAPRGCLDALPIPAPDAGPRAGPRGPVCGREGSGGGGRGWPSGGGGGDEQASSVCVVQLLLREGPDLLMSSAVPQTAAYAGSGGPPGGAGGAAAGGVLACAWRDEALLALHSPECLEILGSARVQALAWALFERFAAPGPQGEPPAVAPGGCSRALRALRVVAPALRERGGRGVTVMEGLMCAYASKPPRLQGGAPKVPDPLLEGEFFEWLARCALAAFGWDGPGARPAQRGSGEWAATTAGGAAAAATGHYSAAAKLLWASPHRPGLITAWVGEAPARSGAANRPSCGRSAPQLGFDTISRAEAIPEVQQTAAERLALGRAEEAEAAAARLAAVERLMLQAAGRQEALLAHAAAVARREELQVKSGQVRR
jgi:hypothetical protein